MPVLPVALPADLSTLARRDLVALAEERGVEFAARDTAESLRERLVDAHRGQVAEYRYAVEGEVRDAYRAKHAPVAPSAPEQITRDALWGLANMFSRMQGEGDILVHAVEAALPLLLAHLKGDERIDRAAALGEVENLKRALEQVAEHRAGAVVYAAFTMRDVQRGVETAREAVAKRDAEREARRTRR
jgi:hypothetical protein